VPSIAIRKPEFESSQLQNVDTKSTASASEEFSASEFIKTAPVLAPAGTTSRYDRPLEINLDLAVYRAKSLARKGDYNNAEEILRHVLRYLYPVVSRFSFYNNFDKQLRTLAML
jgi:hypothetical protein